jgi:hypothetical protein
MSRISFTTRRTVFGLPIGRRHTNWAGVRKAALAGAGVASTAAGGLRIVRRGVPQVVRKLPGQVADTATRATDQLRTASGQLVGVAADRLGQITPGADTDRVADAARSAGAETAAASGKEGRRRTAKKRSDERPQRPETERTARSAGSRRRQRSTSS